MKRRLVLLAALCALPAAAPAQTLLPIKAEQATGLLPHRLAAALGRPLVTDVLAVQPDGAACAKPVSDRSKDNYVKRVVAGPGDKISVVGGHVIRNGVRQKEPFVQEHCAEGVSADFPTTITIPAGHWFMMGDNRECSEDSRFWGPIPEKWIIGGAFATYWPPKRIGVL